MDVYLAWNRVKKDLKNRNFISPISIPEILQIDIDKWLADLKQKFESRNYQPHPMEIVEIPKGKGLIRPGSLLTIDDNIFYSSLVQECYLNVLTQIQWAQNSVDFAYIPTKENVKSADWYKEQLIGWNGFRNKSIENIKTGYQYIIVTDVTGFYENIDISILISDLKICGIDANVVNQLSKCLNRWSQINNRGIPQGNSASDLLAKLYLDTIDKGMKNAGFTHLRYVDDIRIFCKNKSEAKKALIELIQLLRRRGLNLQSSKTEILSANDALTEIEGIQPVIRMIAEKLKNGIPQFLELSSYEETKESTDDDEASIEIVVETFKTYFIEGTDEKFDKTLFHFLINRLKKEKNSLAIDYCLSIIDKHPEETSNILKYLQSFNELDNKDFGFSLIQSHLIKFLSSDEAVYDFQNYQILNWFLQNATEASEKLISLCRQFAFNNNKPYYLRSIARTLLCNFGNLADIDKIGDLVNTTTSDFEKAELLCCLKRMEKGKRNALLGRVENDGQITKMAVNYIKQLQK
ncbi:MAG: RNA-directed DNA polymerase [Bacteroidales bacterium]